MPFPVLTFIVMTPMVAAMLILLFAGGLHQMVAEWSSEEYSHGYMIPFVAQLLVWQRLPALMSLSLRGSWIGFVALALSLFAWLLGELISLFTMLEYGFLFGFYGLVLAAIGVRGTRLLVAPLAYLLFMIPLPNFLMANLSQQLQLISSKLGVMVVRAFDISVYLEGNVIDLGIYKLQVVEACSGLNYLFPLMSFGFLLACLYRGAFWQRALLFLSTVPITILMNSFRIGVIGVLVDRYGIAQAEGFLHYFEGWLIFMACVGVLLLEIWCFNRFRAGRLGVLDSIDLGFPRWSDIRALPGGGSGLRVAPLAASLLLLLLFLPVSMSFASRSEVLQPRESLVQFPLLKGAWIGRQGRIEPDVLASLRLSDHFIADYRSPDTREPVNLYIAYYDSQRKGASVHSPKSCIPGGGWEIKSITRVPVGAVSLAAGPLRVNRVVIQKGEVRQLVYYWFQQRGRVITNEYLVKWFIFRDALFDNRTDGALVRVTTLVPDGADIREADAALGRFIAEFHPSLHEFIPD